MYRRLATRPEWGWDPDVEHNIGDVMSDYLAGIGAFKAWEEHVKSGEVYTIDEVCAIHNP